MEKIYEEKSYSQNRAKMNFSIVLSFVVAAFAVFSLIVVGFNQISYAEPTGTETVDLQFVYFTPGDASTQARVVAEASLSGVTGTYSVPIMMDGNSGKYVFCIQQGIDADATNDYSSEGEVVDPGLIYILNQSSVLGGPGIAVKKTTLTDNEKFIEYYATQVAIWLYLDQQYPSDNALHGKLDTPQLNADNTPKSYTPRQVLTQTIGLDLKGRHSAADPEDDLYDGVNFNVSYNINDLINTAKSENSPKSIWANLSSDSISLVGDNDIYQTAAINAGTNATDLRNYYVDLEGLDGAYIVDAEGNTRDYTYAFGATDPFYVRVPVNKVSEENDTVKIKLSGVFSNYHGGDYYAAGSAQKITKITDREYRVDNEATISFLAPPPTGMSTAQTIYFIGLIVLLCGVGIIYANAKPVEDK